MQLKKEATAVDNANPVAIAMTRAIAYLSNHANDPVALRALIVASGKGQAVAAALDAPLAALKDPAQWPRADHVAYAVALAAAERYGKAATPELEAAAKILTADQQPDGSFGSPINTWLARTALIASGIQPDTFVIVQIDKWFRGATADTLPDALAALLGLELASDVMAENLRRTALQTLRQYQRETGAFGTADEPPPILDTALAIIALSMLDTEPRLARSAFRAEEIKDAIANSKRYLASQQRQDGSWPGPVSTTGWAMLALLSGS